MKHNVGGIDSKIRVLVGLAALCVGVYFKSWWGALGLIPLLTAAISWCPLYMPFGLSTCATKKPGR